MGSLLFNDRTPHTADLGILGPTVSVQLRD